MRYQLAALLCTFACLLQAAAAIPYPEHQQRPAGKVLPGSPENSKPAAPVAAPAAGPVQSTDEAAAFFQRCPQGPEWIKYRNSCYRHYETSQYWYVAEQACKAHGGNLVSIEDQSENSFVAKLTYCQSAWTGKYAVDVDRLSDFRNYRWTDGTNSGYHAHDFTSIGSIHEPLISVSNLKWKNNVYHTKDSYVCEVKTANSSSNCECPRGWKYLNGSCYLISKTVAQYIEADYFCRGEDAHLVSVHSEQELRALSLLDVESNDCPPETWIGLIKINPCRVDFSTGKKICYKWSDRSKDYDGVFPAWHPGNPDNGEQINCVLLKDRAMKTVQCYDRHRFVCKKPADPRTAACSA